MSAQRCFGRGGYGLLGALGLSLLGCSSTVTGGASAADASTGGTSGSAGTVSAGGNGGGSGGSAGSGGQGIPSAMPSCRGDLACHGESCCASALVPGCTACGYPASYTSTVSDFVLDKYEVTVGRFRNFVATYQGPPAADAGQHPQIPGSGWQAAWDGYIAADATELANQMSLRPCDPLTNRTWTDTAGASENKPMNCITWYEAFAFCSWDGGFMPTELEWQYAAGGGTELRQYPWVGTVVDIDHALYGYCGNGVSSDCTVASIAEVGSKPAGAGKWGHLDLAGSMWEWALDVQGSAFPPMNPCDNCASLEGLSPRMIRGGSWYENSSVLNVDNRGANDAPSSSWHNVGIRCARAP